MICDVLKYDSLFVVSGWYWIDPNMGSIHDALQVWCNLTAMGETCIFPTSRTKMVGRLSQTENYTNL